MAFTDCKEVCKKKYFGTDGIRGVYGEGLTDMIAELTGNCLGAAAKGSADNTPARIVVGRDTRVSGKALSDAIVRGIREAGADAVDLAIVSTPCVAYVTGLLGASYGIVVSASHNPGRYNGIKIFDSEGRKLSDAEESEVEKHIDSQKLIKATSVGGVSGGDAFTDAYLTRLNSVGGDLTGMKVVLDCANGAVASYAPLLFERAGAEVFAYNTSRDGRLINKDCGALFPNMTAELVKENGADIGFCFDGDADRVIAADNFGSVVDGDEIVYVIAKFLKRSAMLPHDAVAGTLHTNMGVEKSLNALGIELVRTEIGDHNVMAAMAERGLIVGGEQSGHIILRQYAETGDGLLTALYLCSVLKSSGMTLAELNDSEKYPQINLNIHTERKYDIIADRGLQAFAAQLGCELGERGRVLLRASGTEPKLRIMAECDSVRSAEAVAKKLADCIKENFRL